MALLASFELNWPSEIASIFALAKPVADISSDIFSLHCALRNFNHFSYFYVKLIVFIIGPGLIILLISLVWRIKLRKDTRKNISFKWTVATSFIFLFLVHPSITTIIFQSFLCK